MFSNFIDNDNFNEYDYDDEDNYIDNRKLDRFLEAKIKMFILLSIKKIRNKTDTICLVLLRKTIFELFCKKFINITNKAYFFDMYYNEIAIKEIF